MGDLVGFISILLRFFCIYSVIKIPEISKFLIVALVLRICLILFGIISLRCRIVGLMQ